MNDSSGWIKIHRSILDHWIWKDRIKFGWWLELLFMANWEQKKVLVGNTLITIERGQMIASNSFLMEKWGVCTHTVRNFLRLLEADGMITQTTYPKFNIITICNYDKYQCNDSKKIDLNDDLYNDPNPTPSADPIADPKKEYKKERSKEEKEDTNVSSKKKFSFLDELVAVGVDKQIAEDWIKVRKTKKLSQTETALNGTIKSLKEIENIYGLSFNDAIRICVEHSWGGCRADFFKGYSVPQQQSLFEEKQKTIWQ